MPDDRLVPKAAALLAKAESTTSPEECHALVLRSYSLLARFLNEMEEESRAGVRRHERRLLVDRRRSPRAGAGPEGRGSVADLGRADRRADPLAAYRAVGEPEPPPPHVTISV